MLSSANTFTCSHQLFPSKALGGLGTSLANNVTALKISTTAMRINAPVTLQHGRNTRCCVCTPNKQKRIPASLHPQSGRAANPLKIAVVIYAHHLAASHSDQREHRRRLWIRVQPNVHNADLRLRHTMWRIDHRLKRNS